MENISFAVSALLVFTAILTIGLFYQSTGSSRVALLLIIFWVILQSALGASGFYLEYQARPPRFIFLIAPGLLFVILISFTKNGKKFMCQMDLETLTLLHIVRLPVEIVLFYLFKAKLAPELMTFEGANFDILSGLSAPIIYYLVFTSKFLGKTTLLLWNFLCLGLLLNVLTIAAFSAKTPFQQLAMDQPNVGIGHFPFVLLPAIIVPIVLISHLAAIRQLLMRRSHPDILSRGTL